LKASPGTVSKQLLKEATGNSENFLKYPGVKRRYGRMAVNGESERRQQVLD
jgi:hypothetical protein